MSNKFKLTPERAKKIRLKLGFQTPSAMAEALGLTHVTIYSYESGGPIKKDKVLLYKLLEKASEETLRELGLYNETSAL